MDSLIRADYVIQVDSDTNTLRADGVVLLDMCNYINWCSNCDDIAVVYNKIDSGLCYKNIVDCITNNEDKGIGMYNIADRAVPVGTVDFVNKYLELGWNKRLKPINIPDELMRPSFLSRRVWRCARYGLSQILSKNSRLFIKSDDEVKSMEPRIIQEKDLDTLPERLYFASDVVNFIGEWRAFVYNGSILGVKQYLGDWRCQYDRDIVMNMVGAYNSAPLAYTLDFGVTDNGITAVIEVHNFIGVGLYGFEHKALPYMYKRGFDFEIQR